MGLRRIRHGILWENVSTHVDEVDDWRAPDAQMEHLQSLQIMPIVGLLHHGSGPPGTDLMQVDFPERIAAYAGRVAARYPHVDAWTPVNEPLATARFAGLYGHWHPHRRSTAAFVRIVLNQCRAIVMAMQAIRLVSPSALYVHTDDAGTVYSSPALTYQADLENHRQLLALDLLCGRVDELHPLWHYLVSHGASHAELDWLQAHATPPDVIGADYYVTSDRYLDENFDAYPPESVGGNATTCYADVAAAGSLPGWTCGFESVLRRLWARYSTPVALTEVHIGCTREEQLRWLAEAWDAACRASDDGIPVRAVTAWALLGSFDWDSLCTRESQSYEAGAFDVRGGTPRITAVGRACTDIATTGSFQHRVLGDSGWWSNSAPRRAACRAPLLIFGARGTLGAAFVRRCTDRRLAYRAVERAEIDVTDADAVRRCVAASGAWGVVNATGYVNVDAAENDSSLCDAINSTGAINIARACAMHGIQLATYSSDLVFDGMKRDAYDETDTPNPLNIYGHSKRASEIGVAGVMPAALQIRTGAFFGPWDSHNFPLSVVRRLQRGETVYASSSIITPTYVPALVDSVLDLLLDNETGIWHVSGDAALSWSDFARELADICHLDGRLIRDGSPSQLGWIAERPVNSALTSRRGALLPAFSKSLEEFCAAYA
ncbi:MAG: sugar nucleotide-binding protein [Gemmatimonadaceae bacterium]|nr:sugar nucleotide-binding protein [Gemmatimonadaceae bacterium]